MPAALGSPVVFCQFTVVPHALRLRATMACKVLSTDIAGFDEDDPFSYLTAPLLITPDFGLGRSAGQQYSGSKQN
jgi:hypothetical protein